MMKDLGLLVLRLTTGGLMAGHGSQKLFGWFGGYGLEGTGQFMESLGFKPGKQWATLLGATEFGGGLLTALGLFNPIGPLAIASIMGAAATTAHKGKSVWATEGGAELPITNMAVATCLTLAGPGLFSLDRLFGSRLSIWRLAALGAVGVAVWNAMKQPAPATIEKPQPAPARETGETQRRAA